MPATICANCREELKGTRARMNANGEPVHLACRSSTGGSPTNSRAPVARQRTTQAPSREALQLLRQRFSPAEQKPRQRKKIATERRQAERENARERRNARERLSEHRAPSTQPETGDVRERALERDRRLVEERKNKAKERDRLRRQSLSPDQLREVRRKMARLAHEPASHTPRRRPVRDTKKRLKPGPDYKKYGTTTPRHRYRR